MEDSYNRIIDYARISITDYCNLLCQYCKTGEEVYEENKQMSEQELKVLVESLNELNFKKIRFTGGEPLLAKNIVDIIRHTNNQSNIEDIGLTTNGVLLDKYVDDLILAGLKRINISLDTLDKDKYNEITKRDCFEIVCSNILSAKEKGLIVKINVVLMDNVNTDEIDDFINFGKKHNIQVRFIELMPIGGNDKYIENKKVSILDRLDSELYQKIDSDKKDVSDYYTDKDGYVFGIITPMSNHFCNKCNRIRFTSEGNLRLCLHDDSEVILKPYLNRKEEVKEIIMNSIYSKPKEHLLNENKKTKKGMSKIGG